MTPAFWLLITTCFLLTFIVVVLIGTLPRIIYHMNTKAALEARLDELKHVYEGAAWAVNERTPESPLRMIDYVDVDYYIGRRMVIMQTLEKLEAGQGS